MKRLLPFICGFLVCINVALAADTLVFNDAFTATDGTAITSHTPNTGTSWVEVIDVDGAQDILINSNLADASDCGLSDGILVRANATYNSADYYVQMSNPTVDTGDDTTVIAIRIQDANNMYAMHYIDGQGILYEKVTGTWTALESVQSNANITSGNIIYLEANGSTISWGYGDRNAGTHTEITSLTDTSISAAGYGGFGFGAVINASNDCSAQQVDNFAVYEIDAGTTDYTQGYIF